ncbi:head-tail connector protein [Devosia sp.]|uniref:head-tail connector protein n=1 Tax=Devosia sp. TaxID=1871048 RepID=UPI001AD2B609|nr:head-tail connector protein [Devosia sp.]MBN9333624.1 phage gp6-like head-tail connector protein [Devosia sp.]
MQDFPELELLELALDEAAFRAHLNMTDDDGDEIDAAVLPQFLAAAIAHTERILGFKLDDETELPDGAPADLEQAVLMLGAHWYRRRELSISGTIIAEVPFGTAQILGEYRRYTFG